MLGQRNFPSLPIFGAGAFGNELSTNIAVPIRWEGVKSSAASSNRAPATGDEVVHSTMQSWAVLMPIGWHWRVTTRMCSCHSSKGDGRVEALCLHGALH